MDHSHSVAARPGSETGFGFDAIMRKPDHTRFAGWYARSSYFAPGRSK